ncbi:MAG: hydroxyacid dehydrogenase, partial [Anaerolineales bacterium]|nr:hydroxyacid dehydrogenase [Anaerolineales bacterium]
MTLKILIADGLSEKGVEVLRGAGEVVVNPKITADELLEAIPEYHALIVRSRTKVTAQVIEAGTNLKVIGRAGVGVDNIDVSAALARGVTVVNSPMAATISVAELTFAMMLNLARSIHLADASMKQGKWEKNAFLGSELYGKTLGLIGFGRIGTAVGRRALAFGMSVLAYDPRRSETHIVEKGATRATLDDLLALSDYVSLHLPLSSETYHLMNAERIGKMKRGARLLCLAR